MGVGRSNTPKSFVNACEVFVYTENLAPKKGRDREAEEKSNPEWIPLVAQAIDMASQDDGWSLLAAVGSNLQKLNPAFDSRSYGHKQLSQLVKSQPDSFDIKGKSAAYVRMKP